jgi:hypothetical protein
MAAVKGGEEWKMGMSVAGQRFGGEIVGDIRGRLERICVIYTLRFGPTYVGTYGTVTSGYGG